jgi:hypothetical protein
LCLFVAKALFGFYPPQKTGTPPEQGAFSFTVDGAKAGTFTLRGVVMALRYGREAWRTYQARGFSLL